MFVFNDNEVTKPLAGFASTEALKPYLWELIPLKLLFWFTKSPPIK
jgi:hypothetical protein